MIQTLRNSAGYVEAEITRARIQASQPWTIETPEDAASLGEVQSDGSVEMDVEPGVAKRLNPGEKMNVPAVNSPNNQVEAFLRYLLRDIASGAGPSYESLSKDYSQSNYSSSRLALLDDRDLWRVFQSWFIRSLREPVHREWLQQAVLAGNFSTFSIDQWAVNRERFEAVRFRPRGWGWVDPTKEVGAFKEAIAAGLDTHQDVLAASGKDMEEVFSQLQEAKEMAESFGLSLDMSPWPKALGDDDEAPGSSSEKLPDEPASRRVFHLRK